MQICFDSLEIHGYWISPVYSSDLWRSKSCSVFIAFPQSWAPRSLLLFYSDTAHPKNCLISTNQLSLYIERFFRNIISFREFGAVFLHQIRKSM